MYKSVPPLQEMFNMAGMQLPDYLKGKVINSEVVNNTESNDITVSEDDTDESLTETN